jgi:GT2 family glycosyltransferase
MFDVTASIVLYHNDRSVLQKAILSFLNTNLNVELFLFDNSMTNELFNIVEDKRIIYHFNNKNIGFGSGHNFAIKYFEKKSNYHLVLNPDVYFNQNNIEKIFNYMNNNKSVGLLMPKILYPNNEIQYLCKRNPTPFILFIRRFLNFKFFKHYINSINYSYEFRDFNYNKEISNIPYLSGCFMFFRMNIFKDIGYFDERIFMYIEDADITRRVLSKYKTVYYPYAEVYHHFEKGSHKNLKLMFYSIHGAIIYFNKWGWLK